MKVLLMADAVMLHLERNEAEAVAAALQYVLELRPFVDTALLRETVRQLEMGVDVLDNGSPRAFPIGCADATDAEVEARELIARMIEFSHYDDARVVGNLIAKCHALAAAVRGLPRT